MKSINSPQFFSIRGCIRAAMITGLCCGFLALWSPAPVQGQDVADQIEDRLRPGNTEDPVQENDAGDASDDDFRARVEDALNGRPAAPDAGQTRQPAQDLGQPYYRDAQGRFFFLDPQGGRVYVDQQRQDIRSDREMPRPQAPQGPELGVIITSSPEGIRIDQVQGTSVADEAGIEPGDILQQVDGQRISDPRQLQRLVQSMSAGQSVELTVLRDGEEQTLTATFPETSEDARYGASKPPMDGDKLQQEIEQLRSEVDALRRQMNRLQAQAQPEDAPGDTLPPQPFEQDAQETLETEAATDSVEAEAGATVSEEESAAVRARSSEKIDLSPDEDGADAKAEANAEAAEAEQPDVDPSTL